MAASDWVPGSVWVQRNYFFRPGKRGRVRGGFGIAKSFVELPNVIGNASRRR
jgi:hypothetical protein